FGKYLGPTLVDEKEPLTAWRTWRLTDGGRLHGTWAKIAWSPTVTVAECLAKNSSCNLTMREQCNCGLWGAAALTNLLKHGAVGLYPVGALGRVHLWGFIHVYEYGFRASMGRPVDVWLGNSTAESFAKRLRGTYNVPVYLGLPTEIVEDPDLIPSARVRKAAMIYRSQESVTPIQLEAVAPKKFVHHCSLCGKPGRRDRCPCR